jgi:poly(A) polymerase
VRFTATLEFTLDPSTALAVRAKAGEIGVVSAERIAQELKKMLVDRHRRRAMELAHELGLLIQILPQLAPILPVASGAESDSASAWAQTLERLPLLDNPSFELAMAALLASLPDAVSAARTAGRHLRLSNEESDAMTWLLAHQSDVMASKTKSLAELKRLLVDPRARELIELARVQTLAANGDLAPVLHCQELLEQTPLSEMAPPPLLTGDDLIAMGLKPGKAFRQILDAVRDAQLNGEISSKAEAKRLAKRLAGQQDGGKD